jgi:hypothetical protein
MLLQHRRRPLVKVDRPPAALRLRHIDCFLAVKERCQHVPTHRLPVPLDRRHLPALCLERVDPRHEEITQPDHGRRHELLTAVRIDCLGECRLSFPLRRVRLLRLPPTLTLVPCDVGESRLLAVVTSIDGAVRHGCPPEQSRKFCYPNATQAGHFRRSRWLNSYLTGILQCPWQESNLRHTV